MNEQPIPKTYATARADVRDALRKGSAAKEDVLDVLRKISAVKADDGSYDLDALDVAIDAARLAIGRLA